MKRTKEMKETLTGYAFVAPALIVFTVLIAFPLIASILLSFTEWNFLSGIKNIKWVGLSNFANLLQDKRFVWGVKTRLFTRSQLCQFQLLLHWCWRMS